MSALLRIARAIFGVLSPLTGTVAAGNVTVKATGGDVTLPKYSYAVPLRGDMLDPEGLLKVSADVVVTAAGVSVPVTSVFGGARQNLAAGTKLRWSPGIAGVEPVSVIAAGGLAGGVTASGLGTLQQVMLYERIGAGTVAQDLFAAKVGRFPAAVLEWSGGAPLQTDSRAGAGKRHWEDRWLLSLIVSRPDSHEARSEEAMELLDDVADLITDRSDAGDGDRFSFPGIQVLAAQRVAIAPTSYVYAISFSTSRTLIRKEWRTFNDWLRTRLDIDTQSGDVRGELPLVDNNLIVMRDLGEFSPAFSSSFWTAATAELN